MKRIISILAFGLGSNMLCAETSITDNYGLAGRVAPVVGIRSAEGKWSSAPFKLQIGLEPLGKKKPTQIAEHKIVVDASKLKRKIPDSCIKKFSVPWPLVVRKFPPENEGIPPTEDLWESNKWQSQGQKYELGEQGDCRLTLWVGYPERWAAWPEMWEESARARVAEQFPGLTFAKPISLKIGRVEFAAEGQTIRIDFVAEHKDLPGNWSSYD